MHAACSYNVYMCILSGKSLVIWRVTHSCMYVATADVYTKDWVLRVVQW
jgi:hypothetical protein